MQNNNIDTILICQHYRFNFSFYIIVSIFMILYTNASSKNFYDISIIFTIFATILFFKNVVNFKQSKKFSIFTMNKFAYLKNNNKSNKNLSKKFVKKKRLKIIKIAKFIFVVLDIEYFDATFTCDIQKCNLFYEIANNM